MQGWRQDDGFSLVEMMVVVTIIGLMSSAVVLSLPSDGDRLKERVQATERTMLALARHSVMTGQVLGVRFDADGYQVLGLTDKGWKVNDGLVKPGARTWQPATLAALSVAGADIDVTADSAKPHIWFLPTGEQPAFRLSLGYGDQALDLIADAGGQYQVVRHD